MTFATRRRKVVSSLFVAFCAGSVLLALVPLAFVLFFVVSQGIQSLNVAFFTHMPVPVGEPAAAWPTRSSASLILVGLGALFAVPVGILSGIYMSEYAGHAVRVARAVRGRHAERRAVDRHRRFRLRHRRAAVQAVQRACRRTRARRHDDSDHRENDRGTAAPRARDDARRRAGAGRDAREGRVHRRRAVGGAGHHHRHRARASRALPARRRRCCSRRSTTGSSRQSSRGRSRRSPCRSTPTRVPRIRTGIDRPGRAHSSSSRSSSRVRFLPGSRPDGSRV